MLTEAEARIQKMQEWLRTLGLERYLEKFLKERITLDMLHLLQDDSLCKLGVAVLGDRLRLLESARNLSSTRTPTPTEQPPLAGLGDESLRRSSREALLTSHRYAQRRRRRGRACNAVGRSASPCRPTRSR